MTGPYGPVARRVGSLPECLKTLAGVHETCCSVAAETNLLGCGHRVNAGCVGLRITNDSARLVSGTVLPG